MTRHNELNMEENFVIYCYLGWISRVIVHLL